MGQKPPFKKGDYVVVDGEKWGSSAWWYGPILLEEDLNFIDGKWMYGGACGNDVVKCRFRKSTAKDIEIWTDRTNSDLKRILQEKTIISACAKQIGVSLK